MSLVSAVRRARLVLGAATLVGAGLAVAPAAAAAQHEGHAAAPGAPATARRLGTVVFPTSGAAAAQAPFVEGIALLHNFHYDEAAVAFRRAQAADTAFAAPYWAEALSHSALFWGYESLDTSRAVLARLGPTADARLARPAPPTNARSAPSSRRSTRRRHSPTGPARPPTPGAAGRPRRAARSRSPSPRSRS
jgi:hypothetical protein